MPIPIEYQWMKPETACFINGEDDFIMSGPWKIDHYTWWVDLKYHGPTLCDLINPNNNLYALPTKQESLEFQAGINRRLKEMRG